MRSLPPVPQGGGQQWARSGHPHPTPGGSGVPSGASPKSSARAQGLETRHPARAEGPAAAGWGGVGLVQCAHGADTADTAQPSWRQEDRRGWAGLLQGSWGLGRGGSYSLPPGAAPLTRLAQPLHWCQGMCLGEADGAAEPRPPGGGAQVWSRGVRGSGGWGGGPGRKRSLQRRTGHSPNFLAPPAACWPLRGSAPAP